jgi:hypothetical protein
VELVPVVDVLVGVHVIPALAAGCGRAAVPGDAERLQPAVGKFDQVLLQRIDAEGVGDAIVVQRAVGAVGADEEVVAAAEEGRGDAGVAECRIGEVAEHRRRRRRLHGEIVMRAAVELRFSGMTGRALLPPTKPELSPGRRAPARR